LEFDQTEFNVAHAKSELGAPRTTQALCWDRGRPARMGTNNASIAS